MKTTTRATLGHLHAVQVMGGGNGCAVGAHVGSLARGLVARGVEVTVCGPVGAEAAYQYSKEGAAFRTVEVGAGARDEAAALAVLRYVTGSAGVVHAHGLHAGAVAALALKRLRPPRRRVPLVLTLHGSVDEQGGAGGRLLALLERRVVHSADLVLGASSELVRWARGMGARDARLGSVAVPSAVACPDAARVARRVREELAVGAAPLLLSVGSLTTQHGASLLLDAARDWSGLTPRPVLLLVGEGEQREALQRRIDTERLPVRLLGHRDDVPDLLAAADAVVLPGRWEGRPLLAQEALRGGTPLVSTAVGDIPELVGDAAVLVPYGDVAALAAAVSGLLADPARRAALAEQGRVQASTWPDEDDAVAQVLSIYDELTG